MLNPPFTPAQNRLAPPLVGKSYQAIKFNRTHHGTHTYSLSTILAKCPYSVAPLNCICRHGGKLVSERRNREQETWQIVKRLDAIIKILLETAELKGKPLPISERIEMLYAAGLRPVEISKILGKTTSHITAQLTRIRRSRSKSSE